MGSGGAGRIRTCVKGFASPSLATRVPRLTGISIWFCLSQIKIVWNQTPSNIVCVLERKLRWLLRGFHFWIDCQYRFRAQRLMGVFLQLLSQIVDFVCELHQNV